MIETTVEYGEDGMSKDVFVDYLHKNRIIPSDEESLNILFRLQTASMPTPPMRYVYVRIHAIKGGLQDVISRLKGRPITHLSQFMDYAAMQRERAGTEAMHLFVEDTVIIQTEIDCYHNLAVRIVRQGEVPVDSGWIVWID